MVQSLTKHSLVIISLLVMLHVTQQSGILDFEYTQYLQGLNQNYHHDADFNFTPVKIPPQKLQFPQAANLIDLLNEPIKQKEDHILSSDIDSHLNSMKEKFVKLLTLTQKLSNSEEKIIHFQILINQTNPVAPQQSQIIQLEKYEANLKNFTQRILDLDSQLKTSLASIDSQYGKYHKNEAKRIEVDFKIDWLKEKVNYLNGFEQKARLARQRAGPQIDYSQFFSDLQGQFKNEQGLISQIDLIIQKKDRLGQLRKEKANLNASITAMELYIKDIKECNAQKQTIRKQFKNHQKINQLIHELKELKKNEEPNIYCEGVVKKLTEKIRTMVRYYAIVASCASDLEPKIQDLRREKEKLQTVDEKIAQLQAVENIQDFEKIYRRQKKTIQQMYSKIKDWKMKQFIHDPEKIAEIRKGAEEELAEAKKQKSAITQATTGQPAQQRKTVSNQIVELIKQIRSLKYRYCTEYHQYDSLANTVWSETYRYESQTNLKNKLWKMYRQERKSYENMYHEMIQLRTQIQQLLD